jgi:MoxR-like ATPase
MAIMSLNRNKVMERRELLKVIRKCNPGLKSDFAPSGMVSWMKSFGIIDDSNGTLTLSEIGKQWATRIHWDPPVLDVEPETATIEEAVRSEQASSAQVRLPSIDEIVQSITKTAHFDTKAIKDLHAGLWSDSQRHFAILSGLSGTGKTQLASAYAKSLRPEGGGVFHLAVQPGWYDTGAILGYVNPLRPDAYVRTGFLDFLLTAYENPELPHTAILDEMNLSHPEQYLAPLLSAMETAGGQIEFHQEGDEFDGIPRSIPYPPNLVVIGTVNMDETTHGLSDKVLDRAFTLEFWDIDITAFPNWNAFGLSQDSRAKVLDTLTDLYAALRPAKLHFGWRTVSDVLGFLHASGVAGASDATTEALDSVVYAKVLPKLRGEDSSRFRSALDATKNALAKHGLTRCELRVGELRDDLLETGTARFWR